MPVVVAASQTLSVALADSMLAVFDVAVTVSRRLGSDQYHAAIRILGNRTRYPPADYLVFNTLLYYAFNVPATPEIGYFLSCRSLLTPGGRRSLRGRRHFRKPFGRRPDVLDRRTAASRLSPDPAVEEPDEFKSRSSAAQHRKHVFRRITGGHLEERRIAFVRLIPAYVVLRFEYEEPEIPVYVQICLLGAVWVAEIDAAVPDGLVRQSAHCVSRVLAHAALEVIERLAAECDRKIAAWPVRRYVCNRYFVKDLHAVAIFSPDYFSLFRLGFVSIWCFVALIIVEIVYYIVEIVYYIVGAEIIVIIIIGIVIIGIVIVVSGRMGVYMLRLSRRPVLPELLCLAWPEK